MLFFSLAFPALLLGVGQNIGIASADPITIANSIIGCNDEQRSIINTAIDRAIALATAARDSDWDLGYATWFNRNGASDKCKVKSLMNRIANFDPEEYRTQFVCPAPGSSSRCTEQQIGAVAVQPPTVFGSWQIQLCDNWFNGITANLGCTNIPPTTKIHPTDQAGAILHELMHDDFIFEGLPWKPNHVQDGDQNTCYSPKQITSLARGFDVPACGDPLITASAYEFYSLATFVQGNAGCGGGGNSGQTWAQCQKTFPGY